MYNQDKAQPEPGEQFNDVVSGIESIEKQHKVGNVAADQLRSYIERIEKIRDEKADIATAERDVFAEAKGNGFDVKAMRQILKLRGMESHEREEQEFMLDVYKRALGMALSQPDMFDNIEGNA